MTVSAVMLTAVYLLLLVPERSGYGIAIHSSPATKKAFAWNQDAYWNALEAKYQDLRQAGCTGAEANILTRMEGLRKLLQRIDERELGPEASEFSELELRMFETAPLVSLAREAKEQIK